MWANPEALADMFGSAFSLGASKRETLVWLLRLVVQYGSVCFFRLAAHVPTAAKVDSTRQRFWRFFKNVHLDQGKIAVLIAQCLGLASSKEGWHIQIDRTNWDFGRTAHNLLVLSVLWHGAAVPLFFIHLGKDGNSNAADRIDLMQRFRAAFPDQPVASLTGDREFVGRRWIRWLCEQKIPFVLRHKENMHVFRPGMAPVMLSWLARHLKPGETLNLKGGWRIGQNADDSDPALFLGIKRLADGGLLIVASSYSAKQALADYKLRWKIEPLFGLLKTRGFNLEDTHMKDPKRLELLCGILAMAATICVKVGKIFLRKNPIAIKKHGYPVRSLLAFGLDCVRKMLATGEMTSVFNLIAIGIKSNQ